MSLGVDVGGTFTDLAHWDGTTLRVGKTSSTPDQSDGVVDGAVSLLDGRPVASFLHGTTVATLAAESSKKDDARTTAAARTKTAARTRKAADARSFESRSQSESDDVRSICF